MKRRHLLLIASLLVATACEAVVNDAPGESSTTDNVDAGTSEGSGSADATSLQTTTDASTSGTDEDPSSSTSTDATGSGTSGESSSTGALVECGSPLLDSEDRLQLAGAPMRGNPDALVTLVVWTGYADPFSASLQQTLAALASGPQSEQLRIVSKQMPLPFQDPRGRLARAGLAAHELGAYWEFHDAMFAAEQELDPELVDSIAAGVGLDLDAFHSAMESPEVAARLAEDTALFSAVGATGTPSSIINGELFIGAQPLEGFEQVVASQRAAIDLLIEDGIPACVAFEQRLEQQLP